ncbi:hypothetical protein WMO79_01265 [Micrococcaceae bacterium Sec7.4]
MTAQTEVRPDAAEADAGYRQRIQSAIAALAARGVSEDMIRSVAGLSPERWGRLTLSPTDITCRELTHLSGALLLENIHLLTGDDWYQIQFSPCTWTAMVRSVYPESEIPS